jgi:hypothetical protein
MSKIGYTVIIERFERLCDCNQEVGDEILRKTFDTIDEANDFISSFKRNIKNSADPEFSLIEDRGGHINIIELSLEEDFEYETRFTFKQVNRPESAVVVTKNKLIEERHELKDEEYIKLLDKLMYLAKNQGYDSAQNILRKNKPEDDFGHIDKDELFTNI